MYFQDENADEAWVIFAIADKIPESMRKALIDEPFTPQPAAALAEGISVMEQVKRQRLFCCLIHMRVWIRFCSLLKKLRFIPML